MQIDSREPLGHAVLSELKSPLLVLLWLGPCGGIGLGGVGLSTSRVILGKSLNPPETQFFHLVLNRLKG